MMTAKSMGPIDLLKNVTMADIGPQTGVIHEASMSEANQDKDQLSVGDGQISDASSVKLPSDSYDPEHAHGHSARPQVEELKAPP